MTSDKTKFNWSDRRLHVKFGDDILFQHIESALMYMYNNENSERFDRLLVDFTETSSFAAKISEAHVPAAFDVSASNANSHRANPFRISFALSNVNPSNLLEFIDAYIQIVTRHSIMHPKKFWTLDEGLEWLNEEDEPAQAPI